MGSNINTAVVGYGYAGRCFHSYLIDLTDGLNLYAISTRDEGRRKAAEKDYGVKTYSSIDDLLKDDKVELVVIATPHDTHKELCIKAMDAGKHVVVDKVMCLTTQEADSMIEAAKRNKVLFSVFHNRRWDGDYLTVRKVIESGMLGEVFLVESTVLGYGRPRGWRASKAQSGGQLYDWGAHLVDHALLIANSDVKSLYCDCEYGRLDMDADSHLKLLIRFETGLLYSIELSRLARIPKPRWYVLGDNGSLVKTGVDPQEAAMVAGDIDAARELPENRAVVKTEVNGMMGELTIESVRGNWKAYYQNISDVLNKGAELAVKPEEARNAVAVIEAAMKSAETGDVVHGPLFIR